MHWVDNLEPLVRRLDDTIGTLLESRKPVEDLRWNLHVGSSSLNPCALVSRSDETKSIGYPVV